MSGDVLAVSGVEKVVDEVRSNDVTPEWCGLGGAPAKPPGSSGDPAN
jgi:hypothetical protein